MKILRPKPDYFAVGYYGQGFPSFLRVSVQLAPRGRPALAIQRSLCPLRIWLCSEAHSSAAKLSSTHRALPLSPGVLSLTSRQSHQHQSPAVHQLGRH